MSLATHHLGEEIGAVMGASLWSLCLRRKGKCFVLWNEEEEGSVETSVCSAKGPCQPRVIEPWT